MAAPEKTDPDSQDPARAPIGAAVDRGTQAISVALTFAVAVALFGYGGYWLDDHWGSSPWLLLLGVTVGMVGGFLHVVLKLAPDMLPWGTSTDAPEDPGADP